MNWNTFAHRFVGTPVLTRTMLDTMRQGQERKQTLSVQLSRWVRAGRLIRLGRGRYLLPEPWASAPPPALVANELVYPSYVSMAYALQYYDLIPEGVGLVTSVTTKRPARFDTDVGQFRFRHIQRGHFFGSTTVTIDHYPVRMAEPEKALLDFLYYEFGPMTVSRIEEYRFQNLDKLNLRLLKQFAARMGSRKLSAAVAWIQKAAKK